MDDREDMEEALLSRIRKIDPQNAQEVVSAIMLRHKPEKIQLYISGLDDNMRSLIDDTKRYMELMSKAAGPVQKLAHSRKENQLQSSRKPVVGSSNAMRYPQSRPEPWNIACNYINDGFCTEDVSCPRLAYNGFSPLGRLEMEIRHLLIRTRPSSVLLMDLPNSYYWQYKKHLPADGSFRVNQFGMIQWDGKMQCNGMVYSLTNLHTVMTFADRHYGVITNVQVLVVDNRRRFGFVTFLYRQTVNLLLSNWNSMVPHLIYGQKLFAKCYKPIAERIHNEGDNVIQLLHASDGPKEEKVPEHNSILSCGENEPCPHLLCEIITVRGVHSICPGCQKLLRQIMELVRMREKCLDCGELLNQITESVRKSDSCARCQKLLRQIIQFSQQEG